MVQMVIFDFNRTLYDPVEKKVIEGSVELLQSLKPDHILILISFDKENRNIIAQGLFGSYFTEMLFVSEKTTTLVKDILQKYHCNPAECAIIGDTFEDEIVIGKQLGCLTIHFNPGLPLPEAPYTITELKEALALLG